MSDLAFLYSAYGLMFAILINWGVQMRRRVASLQKRSQMLEGAEEGE